MSNEINVMGILESNGVKLHDAVISDKTFKLLHEKGILIENEVKDEQIQPNSVDLTLAATCKKIKSNNDYENGRYIDYCIDPQLPIKYDTIDFVDDSYIMIEPGEFYLLASNEILNIPNGILSFVQGRSSIARMGIQTEQAGLIDAGFRGTITFEVFNQTRYAIKLYKGMRIAQVYFFKAQEADIPYGELHNSKYSGQIQASGSRIHEDFYG